MPADPSIPPATSPEGRLAEKLASLERRLSALEAQLQGGTIGQFPVVDALPIAGRKGRVRYLTTDNRLYIDNGTAWVAQT